MNRTSRHYGWRPDLPDHRDFKYAAPEPILADLPASVDLRAGCPAIYDQGELNSCTANAIAGAFEFELLKQAQPDFTPSRLFIYYNERVIENSVNTDAGAYNRDGLNTVSNQGVCTEDSWPYNISEFAQKPYESCYQAALHNLVTNYFSVNQDINQMKGCLAEGYLFIFGFTVYESFDSSQVAQTGIVSLPAGDESVAGGHCVLAVGYDDAQNSFIARNSWGPNWGQDGYFTIPYDYLTNSDLSSDFWTIRVVTENDTPADADAPAFT
jgi:C1A family cysteine protease